MDFRSRTVVVLLMLVGPIVGNALPAAATSASGRFTDDDGYPAEPYIERLAELGVISGCNPPANTKFCPDRDLNRAEAAKILVRVGQAYGNFPAYPSSLIDRFVDDDEIWDGTFSHLADFLAAQGVIDGCDPPKNIHYCPTQLLTRAQVAKIVVNTFDLTAPDGYQTPWTDTAGRWYQEAARVAAYHGLWDVSAGRFDGAEEMRRADFARIVVTAAGEDLCPANPFTASRVRSLEAAHPHQKFTAYAFDTRTGCAYWMNPDQRLKTASVFKVMVMSGTLLEAQDDGRSVSSYEMSRLVPMITESANQPVRDLWSHFGGSPWFRRQTEIFGMTQTHAVGDGAGAWGTTTTSALDQANLIRQVLLGQWGPLQPAYRDQAWDLMTSVIPAQRWGVTKGVPSGWTVAQKNGFAGSTTNSIGFVRAPGSQDGYVIAVLSNGWSGWEKGVSTVEQIAGWVSGELAH